MEQESLAHMSSKTGIPIAKIKLALNLPFHKVSHAKDLKEALLLYNNSNINSEEQEIHLKKANDFFLEDIKKLRNKSTTTRADYLNLYSMCPSSIGAYTVLITEISKYFNRN